jgi:hypothetical protein
MALTLTETKVIQIGTNESLVYGTITFLAADTYTTGGFDVTAQIPGSREYEDARGRRTATSSLRRRRQVQAVPADGAATSALVEVPNATDVSSASPINFIGVRPIVAVSEALAIAAARERLRYDTPFWAGRRDRGSGRDEWLRPGPTRSRGSRGS